MNRTELNENEWKKMFYVFFAAVVVETTTQTTKLVFVHTNQGLHSLSTKFYTQTQIYL